MKSYFIKTITFIVMVILTVSCGSQSASDSSTSSSTVDSTVSSAFPTSLAIASPFSYSSSSSSSLSLSARYSSIGSSTSVYKEVTENINDILSGTTSPITIFSPSEFLLESEDADCYGPAILYEDHPDGSSTNSGELPVGDVGIWLETDASTGNACAAAQLEARLTGIQSQANASFMAIAAMIYTVNDAGKSLPDTLNPSVDITSDINGLGTYFDTTFNSATIAYDAATGAYTYALDLTYTSSGDSYDIVVSMTHLPGTSGYSGVLSFMINDTLSYYGNCPTTDITRNGSVQYEMVSSTEMKLQARSAILCEHDSNGWDSNGLVDPTNKFNSSSNPTGWANTFDVFTANYDPADLDGDYSYIWQAGHFDGNTRAFNVNVSNSGQEGFAFYGYGDDVATSDGSIEGFICNWAGPGNNHTLIDYAQYQEMSVSGTTVNSDSAQFVYAPTVDCTYDGSSTFLFDTDADGSLSDESYSTSVGNDLYEAVDVTGDSAVDSITDNITYFGFTLPTM